MSLATVPIIERVITLKTVSIFSQTPDRILAELAQLLEEEIIEANTNIFRKGDAGHKMYIIVSGAVEVHDEKRVITTLGKRATFGEMALLDDEPRSAAITTTEPTHLLTLDRSTFFELMESQIEIAHGVIRVLSRQLRERLIDLNTLKDA